MNCTTALDLILEADPAELRGERPSELATHLRSCEQCRAAAARVLEAERVLADVFASSAPGPSTPEAVTAATREAARRTARRRLWSRGVPLAAAAVLGGIAVLSRNRPPPPLLPTAVAPSVTATPGVLVQGPPGRGVAVLQTDNPDIVVIWFF